MDFNFANKKKKFLSENFPGNISLRTGVAMDTETLRELIGMVNNNVWIEENQSSNFKQNAVMFYNFFKNNKLKVDHAFELIFLFNIIGSEEMRNYIIRYLTEILWEKERYSQEIYRYLVCPQGGGHTGKLGKERRIHMPRGGHTEKLGKERRVHMPRVRPVEPNYKELYRKLVKLAGPSKEKISNPKSQKEIAKGIVFGFEPTLDGLIACATIAHNNDQITLYILYSILHMLSKKENVDRLLSIVRGRGGGPFQIKIEADPEGEEYPLGIGTNSKGKTSGESEPLKIIRSIKSMLESGVSTSLQRCKNSDNPEVAKNLMERHENLMKRLMAHKDVQVMPMPERRLKGWGEGGQLNEFGASDRHVRTKERAGTPWCRRGIPRGQAQGSNELEVLEQKHNQFMEYLRDEKTLRNKTQSVRGSHQNEVPGQASPMWSYGHSKRIEDLVEKNRELIEHLKGNTDAESMHMKLLRSLTKTGKSSKRENSRFKELFVRLKKKCCELPTVAGLIDSSASLVQ